MEKKILKRDKYKCVKCKSNKNIEVDHIYSFRKIIEKYNITSTIEANRCKMLWNIKNGRVLCKRCHKDTENWGYKNV
jgi:5-methylcytosine-specific restriction endonuclease McrA